MQHATQSEVSEQTQGNEEHLPPSKKKRKPLNLFKFLDNITINTSKDKSLAEAEVKDYLSTPCSSHDTNIL